ncbi:MAG: alanyl-tRNA editing protein [Conexivisphaera sp.]|nr:alanyl-tRNA editing protein [Conexivisphaerales archaeon]
MPTDPIYLRDAYARRFEAVVNASGDDYVVLDRTAFYPGGGGQPPDSGTLDFGEKRVTVVEAFKMGEDVAHRLQGEVPPPGTAVVGELDWGRRYAHMRLHTAIHLLDALLLRRNVGGEITGGQIYDDRARVDFDWPDFSREALDGLVEEANSEIRRGRRVLVKYLSREEAMAIPNLARTAPGRELLARLSTVRVVEIEGLDVQMDGGTHVADIGEIGTIRPTRVENKGRRNKRVEFVLE